MCPLVNSELFRLSLGIWNLLRIFSTDLSLPVEIKTWDLSSFTHTYITSRPFPTGVGQSKQHVFFFFYTTLQSITNQVGNFYHPSYQRGQTIEACTFQSQSLHISVCNCPITTFLTVTYINITHGYQGTHLFCHTQDSLPYKSVETI